MITTEPSHPTLFALGCHTAIFISDDFALRELVTPSSLRTLAPRRTRTRWMGAARNPSCWWAMSSFVTSSLFSFFIRTRGPLLNCPENCSGWFKIFFRESGGGEWNTNRDLRRPSQFQRLDSETGGGGRHNSILKVALQIFIFVLLVNIFIIKQLWRDRQVAALLRDCPDSLGGSHIFLEAQSKPSKCRRTLQKRPSSACGAVLVGAKPLNCGEQLVFGRTRFSTTSPPRAWTAARPGSDLVPQPISSCSCLTFLVRRRICLVHKNQIFSSPASIRLATSQSIHRLSSPTPQRFDVTAESIRYVVPLPYKLRLREFCAVRAVVGWDHTP